MKTKLFRTLLFLPLVGALPIAINSINGVFAKDSAGTYSNPILINSVDDLKSLGETVAKGEAYNLYYKLNQDLDLNKEEWTPIGSYSAPFNGHFDGNGHTITNLKITRPDKNNVGFFGYVLDGSVEKLTVKGNVIGNANVGGIAGYSLAGITNCTSFVDVIGGYCVGGIIGNSSEDLINNSLKCYGFALSCHNYGNVEGTDNVGGIIGYDMGDGASRCGNYGRVTSDYSAGGIIGYVARDEDTVYTSPIIDCFNVGEITGGNEASGIACGAPSDILTSYNAGKITANINAGAITSSNNSMNVAHCYNVGSINGVESNRFAGSQAEVDNCYSILNSTESKYGVEMIGEEEFKVLASRIGHGYENNATVGRPILTDNKEVPTAYVHTLEYVPEIPATCTSEGVRAHYICHCGCGHSYFNSNATWIYNSVDAIIPKLDHDFAETPNEDGSVTYTCKDCGYTKTHYALNAEGKGNVVNPYLINNESQLAIIDKNVESGLDNYEGVYFKQTANIVINKDNVFNGIGKANISFNGNYDGQMFAISILGTANCRGLFSRLENATIQNVYLNEGKINCDSYCGSIAGIATNSVIQNCYSALDLIGGGISGLGGIVGKSDSCIISGCCFTGTIKSSTKINNLTGYIGGLCGNASETHFSHCVFGGEFLSLKTGKFDLVTPDKNNSLNKGSYLYNINSDYSYKNSSFDVQWLCTENLPTFLEDNEMFDYAKEENPSAESGFDIYDDAISYKGFYNNEFPMIIDVSSKSNATGTSIGAGNIALIVVGSVIIVGGILVVVFRKKIFKKAK